MGRAARRKRTASPWILWKSPARQVQTPDLPGFFWLREVDLNHRPSGYEPDELPGCSIPRKTGRARVAYAVSSNRKRAWEAAQQGNLSSFSSGQASMVRSAAVSRTSPRKADSGSTESLRSASGEILAEARRQIDEPGADDATAVHEFRKAMKRWRALLRLYEPVIGEQAEQLRIDARDLARELAGTRDARSALDAVADLGEEVLSARTRATLKERLEGISMSSESATLTYDLRERMRLTLDHAAAAAAQWALGDVAFATIADGLAAS